MFLSPCVWIQTKPHPNRPILLLCHTCAIPAGSCWYDFTNKKHHTTPRAPPEPGCCLATKRAWLTQHGGTWPSGGGGVSALLLVLQGLAMVVLSPPVAAHSYSTHNKCHESHSTLASQSWYQALARQHTLWLQGDTTDQGLAIRGRWGVWLLCYTPTQDSFVQVTPVADDQTNRLHLWQTLRQTCHQGVVGYAATCAAVPGYGNVVTKHAQPHLSRPGWCSTHHMTRQPPLSVLPAHHQVAAAAAAGQGLGTMVAGYAAP